MLNLLNLFFSVLVGGIRIKQSENGTHELLEFHNPVRHLLIVNVQSYSRTYDVGSKTKKRNYALYCISHYDDLK
jgi:hypothetical protein